MSVIWSNERGWIVCHSLFLHKIYKGIENEQLCPTCQRYRIFHINEPFLKRGEKSRTKFVFNNDIVTKMTEGNERNIPLGDYSTNDFKLCEAHVLPTIFSTFMCNFLDSKVEYFFEKECPDSSSNNMSAIDVANAALLRIPTQGAENYDGGNLNDNAVAVNVKNELYFIPSRCRFYNYDIGKIRDVLSQANLLYDLVLIDPPWQNKHIRRKNAVALGYNMLKMDHLVELPIDDYLSATGLLAVWCTNSPQQIRMLINHLFPRWNVEYVSTWYWIKVTRNAQPICDFSDVCTHTFHSSKKQPFERIIFATRVNRGKVFKNPPPNKIIVSIPSAIHSHKPPLTEVLKEYLAADCRCIELFARYLLPNWTSYGNEVLKLQTSFLFTK